MPSKRPYESSPLNIVQFYVAERVAYGYVLAVRLESDAADVTLIQTA